MLRSPHQSLARCTEALQRLLEEDAALGSELKEARESYVRGKPPATPMDLARVERRFREWFLFERRSRRYGEPPALTFQERLRKRLGDADGGLAERLNESVFGIFEVSEVLDGGRLAVRDLLNPKDYLLRGPWPNAARAGDAVAGRLFETAEGDHILSPDTGLLLRDPKLLEALRSDLRKARSDRPGSRLSQAELETVLWHFPPGHGLALPEIEKRWGKLVRMAPPRFDAARVRQRLEASADPGPEVSRLLDELAFDSGVDLDEARLLLLDWLALLPASRASPDAPCPCGSGSSYGECCLPADAVAAFEKGKAAGENLDSLFLKLEADLGIEPDPGYDVAEESTSSEPEIADLVREYLWEAMEEDKGLLTLASYLERDCVPPVSRLDEVGARHLADFLARRYPAGPEGRDPKRARALLEALDRFGQWADREQGATLGTFLRPLLAKLRDELPRIALLNASLPQTPPAHGRLRPFRVQALQPSGTVLLEKLDDGQVLRVTIPHYQPLADSAPGDLAGIVEDPPGDLRVVCFFPAAAEPYLR